MSLDVYLKLDTGEATGSGSGVFVRENGKTREISRVEWDERFPGCEPITVRAEPDRGTVYTDNITHNLGAMAAEAGIYTYLWRPDELEITKAQQLIEPLRRGYSLLIAQPKRFRKLNPPNGWGTYEVLVEFVADYLAACQKYPEAAVSVSR